LLTGSSKWLYISLIVLLTAFIGISVISVKLYADNAFLTVQNKAQGDTITKLSSDNKELLRQVSEKRKEVDLVNEIAKQNAIDKEKNMQIVKDEKTEIEARYKKLRDSLNKWEGDKNATSCQNAVNFVNSLSN
jgi:hypothetical protein